MRSGSVVALFVTVCVAYTTSVPLESSDIELERRELNTRSPFLPIASANCGSQYGIVNVAALNGYNCPTESGVTSFRVPQINCGSQVGAVNVAAANSYNCPTV